MANVRGTKGTEEMKHSRNLKNEEFVPSSDWTEDSMCHYLLVDLPGFKKEEVKVQVDASGLVTIKGERRVNENKYSSFEKTFNVPENSDIRKITGKFESEILYVTVPKQVIEEKKELFPEKENQTANSIGDQSKHDKPNNKEENMKEDSNKHGDGDKKGKKDERNDETEGLHEKRKEKGVQQSSLLANVMKELKKNKVIVITAVLAFSLGVLVTHKFESYGQYAALHNSPAKLGQ